jgi:nucleotide-binding universal stress UspA family protein/RimJ/RimL family protein N-acetyltransferase
VRDNGPVSADWPVSVALRDGARIVVRPIEPEDRDELAAGFERLSPESRYRRFFGPMRELRQRDLGYLTQVDHRDHEALIGLDDATGQGVAVARFVRTAPDEAEPAVVVADDWQRRGVGSSVLELLAARAREEGIGRFRAPVLATNADAIALLRRLGDVKTTRMGREVELEIQLAPHDEGRRDLRVILREVAAGTLTPARTLLQRLLPRRSGPPDRAALRNTIVVGTDGSELAGAAVRGAAELAPALGASGQLVAVHWPVFGDREAMDAVLRGAECELRERGVDVTSHVRRGDPAASLMDVAEEERARLIMLGARGETSAAQLLLGSVSETVAAHAPCDVMIVRER